MIMIILTNRGGRKIFFQCGRKHHKNFSVGVNVIRNERTWGWGGEVAPRLELVTFKNIFL